MTKAERDALVASMALMVRVIYVACRRTATLAREGVSSTWGDAAMPRWDGGETATATYTPVWPKIAKLCIKHQAEPGVYVKAQFDEIKVRIPWPSDLLGESAIARYTAFAGRNYARLREALLNQSRDFDNQAHWLCIEARHGITLDEAASRVLRDTSFGITPLFRHCVASRFHAIAIAERFRDAALLQYVFQRKDYDNAWGDTIPQSLRDDADEFLANLT